MYYLDLDPSSTEEISVWTRTPTAAVNGDVGVVQPLDFFLGMFSAGSLLYLTVSLTLNGSEG